MQLCFLRVFIWKLSNCCRCSRQSFRRDLSTVLYVIVCKGTNLALNKKKGGGGISYFFFIRVSSRCRAIVVLIGLLINSTNTLGVFLTELVRQRPGFHTVFITRWETSQETRPKAHGVRSAKSRSRGADSQYRVP